MMNYLNGLTVRQCIEVVVGLIAVVSFIIEWDKKLPYHPASSFISWIGRNLMKDALKELNKKIDEMEKENKEKCLALSEQQKANNEAIIELSNKVDKKFEEQKKEDDEKEAKRLRANIICFSDSCRIHEKHTKRHFENIFRDYDDYMMYCEKHNLANHYIDEEYEYIKGVYQECVTENKFL